MIVNLQSELILDIFVDCSDFFDIGDSPDGNLKIIPIIGGSFSGNLSGEVLSFGADWNLSMKDNTAFVHAKYILKTEKGDLISIDNKGLIDNSTENKIITKPTFKVSEDSEYSWLNYGVYVGELNPVIERKNSVNVKIYKML